MIRPTRREFLQATVAGAASAAFAGGARGADAQDRPRTILLYGSWQTVNIGDIAHTPGLLALIGEHLPGTRVILWPAGSLDRGVEPMLTAAFPDLRIVKGAADAGPVADAIAEADLFLHGSGPHINVAKLEAWRKTGKPYGAYGDTFSDPIDDRVRSVLSEAAFVFTRETKSLDRLRDGGVKPPTLDFAPDATFGFGLRNESAADAELAARGLEAGKFVCVVPRLRKTPYYKIKPNRGGWSDARIRETDALNAQWAEPDHAKARAAMIRYVRETGRKVYVCPEMTYQLEIMDELLIDPLPADVKPHVVKRDSYWLPDEAASVYRRAEAVLSFECHSPILAFAAGTPAFYLRQPEDTIKGQMWYDVGAADWVFEIEQTSGERIAERLMAVHERPDEARASVAKAMDKVRERQRASLAVVGRAASG